MALRDRCHESLACRMLGEYQLAAHRDGGKGQHAQLHRLVQHVEDLEPVLSKARIGSTGASASRLRSASQLMQPHVQARRHLPHINAPQKATPQRCACLISRSR
jgi:hypothetical protein